MAYNPSVQSITPPNQIIDGISLTMGQLVFNKSTDKNCGYALINITSITDSSSCSSEKINILIKKNTPYIAQVGCIYTVDLNHYSGVVSTYDDNDNITMVFQFYLFLSASNITVRYANYTEKIFPLGRVNEISNNDFHFLSTSLFYIVNITSQTLGTIDFLIDYECQIGSSSNDNVDHMNFNFYKTSTSNKSQFYIYYPDSYELECNGNSNELSIVNEYNINVAAYNNTENDSLIQFYFVHKEKSEKNSNLLLIAIILIGIIVLFVVLFVLLTKRKKG